MRLPRFHVRTLMVAVAVVAVSLAMPAPEYSWWRVKPLLNIAFIPLLSMILAMRAPPRRMILVAATLNALFFLFWFHLKRPMEGMVIGIPYPEHIRYYLLDTGARTILEGMGQFFEFQVSYGTVPDLLSLAVSSLMLAVLLARPIPYPARIAWAATLALVRIYDWATTKPSGGTAVFPWAGDNNIPLLIAEGWLRGDGKLVWLWQGIGLVKGLELTVLVIVLSSLLVTALRPTFRQGASPVII